MSLDRSGLDADEYYVTALQIFDYCGADSTGTLRVETLMDKFAPFVKTNKIEYSYLKSLLDPHEDNPEVSVSMLAKTLHKYSEKENHKSKMELDESFNLLRNGQGPQDSDSGISMDGFQLLEDLQCQLREKAHLTHQLRSQLDFTDRQHEEALAALTAERDSLRTHLNVLRDENMGLKHIRHDYEDVCERLCTKERNLEEVKRELEVLRRRNKITVEQVSTLENEKLTLQELLSKSKAECHRINEMYASRQSALLEESEVLRAENAELSARMQDQEEFVQQIIKEKVVLEMEQKDLLNKCNQTQLRMDRSIDISYTEDQMLTALDSLNADSRFSQDNRILDDESFIAALKEDQGRSTNISLFDEIRLSFCNKSRFSTSGIGNITSDKHLDSLTFNNNFESSFMTVGTQTEIKLYDNSHKDDIYLVIEKQTEVDYCTVRDRDKTTSDVSSYTQTENEFKDNKPKVHIVKTVEIQTDTDYNTKCLECENANQYAAKLERDVRMSHSAVSDMQKELSKYENALTTLQKFLDEGNERNGVLQAVIKDLETKISILETACVKQTNMLETLAEKEAVKCDQSNVSTQVDTPCADCVKRTAVVPHRSLRKFFWGPIKCLFQLFAVICFISAVSMLYGVSRARPPCPRAARPPGTPWRWMDAQDIMDLLLRIDYVAEVPM